MLYNMILTHPLHIGSANPCTVLIINLYVKPKGRNGVGHGLHRVEDCKACSLVEQQCFFIAVARLSGGG